MNDDLNPQAMPFRPGGGSDHRRPWDHNHNHSHSHNYNYNYNERPPPAPPSMPPPGPPNAPWNANHGPPQFFTNNQYDDFAAHEQARAFHWQWAQHHGQPNYQPPPQPYGPPPLPLPQQHYPHYQQQQSPYQNHAGYPHPPYPPPVPQPRMPWGANNEELQYAFNALIKGLRSKNSGANDKDRMPRPPQPPKKSKKAKAKAKAAADGEFSQEYGFLHRVDPFPLFSSRINKRYSTPQASKTPKKGRLGDEKIMLPAPQSTDLYMSQASEEPSVIDPPGQLLVILDLNGTVLYRPNKNAQTMIARPYLKPFLQYLFSNFKVMVWSSAKPVNVKALVDQSLEKDLRSMLVATWARDTFGLSATNYSQNVQVYKNLRLVWSRDVIQQHHPEYAAGKRFGQHNTVLIDDSAIKASAQPHNLLEIPEFEATPEQMEGDVLREVAGYLEVLRQQADVSRFIKKEPFKGDGRWSYDWAAESAGGGDMTSKITLKGKSLTPGNPVTKTKKLSKSKSPSPAPVVPMSEMMNSLSSVSLDAHQR
jgi:hypothetical protein